MAAASSSYRDFDHERISLYHLLGQDRLMKVVVDQTGVPIPFLSHVFL